MSKRDRSVVGTLYTRKPDADPELVRVNVVVLDVDERADGRLVIRLVTDGQPKIVKRAGKGD